MTDEEMAEEYQIRKHHQRLYGSKPVVMKELNTTYKDGFNDGYNKANEWHDLKTKKPQLRKEVLWLIDNQVWLGELFENRIDFDEWELYSVLFNNHEIRWKEIVLPELKENE
jgi:hypothetical protein